MYNKRASEVREIPSRGSDVQYDKVWTETEMLPKQQKACDVRSADVGRKRATDAGWPAFILFGELVLTCFCVLRVCYAHLFMSCVWRDLSVWRGHVLVCVCV